MRRIALFFAFVMLVLLSYLNIYAEEQGNTETTDNIMKLFAEDLKAYYSALQDFKETEMSKYCKPYYTYDNSILEGVAFISDPDDNGNFPVIFIIKNNTKSAINLKKVFYRAIKNPNLNCILEKPIVFNNEGIESSFILNPTQETWVYLTSPFKDLDIKEIYIKLGDKRVFFVPEEKIDKYKELGNRILRHLRNLWWNVK